MEFSLVLACLGSARTIQPGCARLFLFRRTAQAGRSMIRTPDDDADAESRIERALAWFDNKDEAIQMARQRAIEWIDAREGNIVSTDTDSSIRHYDIRPESRARERPDT